MSSSDEEKTNANATPEVLPEALEKDKEPRGRHYTVSIALPGSILDNAQSFELRCYVAGQIARAAAVFSVDEVVVFDDAAQMTKHDCDLINQGIYIPGNSCGLMAKILRFLECPQYLRKHLFPLSSDLKCAGLLNPLCCFHHFDKNDTSLPYREAVVLSKPVKRGRGSLCYAGLQKDVEIDKNLATGTRVTVKLNQTDHSNKLWKASVVSPLEPVQKFGYYWGYNVRVASSISAVINEAQAGREYDLLIGTSDQGESVACIQLPKFKHLLIVFGGLNGIEYCIENDHSSQWNGPKDLFHYYVNTCLNQGCRTIRTEEAVLISLGALQCKISKAANELKAK